MSASVINDKTNIPLFVAVAATVAIVGGVITFVVFAMKLDNRLTMVEHAVARIEMATADSTPWSSFVNWTEDLRERNSGIPNYTVPNPRR